MLGAILATVGSLISGGASAAVELGSSILGGVGELVFGGGQIAGVDPSFMTKTGLISPGVAGPAVSSAAGGGLLEGVAGIGGQLADILPTVSGIMSVIKKPEEQEVIPARAGTLPTPRITIPTLPAVMPKQAQPGQQIFTTPAATAKPDYLPYLAIGGLALLLFMRKK